MLHLNTLNDISDTDNNDNSNKQDIENINIEDKNEKSVFSDSLFEILYPSKSSCSLCVESLDIKNGIKINNTNSHSHGNNYNNKDKNSKKWIKSEVLKYLKNSYWNEKWYLINSY